MANPGWARKFFLAGNIVSLMFLFTNRRSLKTVTTVRMNLLNEVFALIEWGVSAGSGHGNLDERRRSCHE
ncbi:hypothetical protein SAMN06298226_1489 [Nitrosovibrio sp. Nv4]|nr:hypothetical protein SAMN06298226_1489 [Nitrosovibrio sp. Nv4]